MNKRGPALFKDPTPLKRIEITDKASSKYVISLRSIPSSLTNTSLQKAKGLFESDFVLSVAAPLLKIGGAHLPFGAVALAAAAVCPLH